PNGKQTNLTEHQWLQVRTENFKAWFGDWENDPKNASKVVDENGEPLVVYHGGTAKEVFTANGYSFFTEDKDLAEDYAPKQKDGTRNVISAFLNVRDLMVFDKRGHKEASDYIYEALSLITYRDDLTDKESNMFKNLKKEYGRFLKTRIGQNYETNATYKAMLGFIDEFFKFKYEQLAYQELDPILPIINTIGGKDGMVRAYGAGAPGGLLYMINDGKVSWDEAIKEYIVFDHKQIKSATDNVGTFDGGNADIRYRLADEDANRRFNEGLANYDPLKHRTRKYSLGYPGAILRESGIGEKEIWIRGSTMQDKSSTSKHPFDLQELRDLPMRINDPIFVMDSVSPNLNDADNTKTILTEIRTKTGNLLAILRATQIRGGIEISQIVSIYPKKNAGVIGWLNENQDAFLFINKEKALKLLSERYEGSNSPRSLSTRRAIDKISEKVGLSSEKFAEVRKALLKDGDSARYRLTPEDIDARLKQAHTRMEKYKANENPLGASRAIAKEIAKEKKLDAGVADDKIGRMVRAAYREGEGAAKEGLAAFGIAMTDSFIETNKPDGTNKKDLVFHMDEALDYARDLGLSEEDVKNLGADRFTYYLQGLNMYAYGNALMHQLNEKYAEKQALSAQGISNEKLDAEIGNLVAMVADARMRYENMKGNAGRILQHARWEKSNRINELIKIADHITIERDRINAEIAGMQAELAEVNAALSEVEAAFNELMGELAKFGAFLALRSIAVLGIAINSELFILSTKQKEVKDDLRFNTQKPQLSPFSGSKGNLPEHSGRID
ncbi:MAG: hypothetical protein WCY84_04645, partial [Candidatus Cloacimonadaceae bacterium]